MAEVILSIFFVLGIALYVISHYKIDLPPEYFQKGDIAQIGNPVHKDYPKKVTIIEANRDYILCRFDDGKDLVVKHTDLTKQSF